MPIIGWKKYRDRRTKDGIKHFDYSDSLWRFYSRSLCEAVLCN